MDLRGASASCQAAAVQALSCLGSVLATQSECQPGMLAAALTCSGLLEALECDDEPAPPPDCPGHGSTSPGFCTLTYECGQGQTYGVQCSSGTCECLRNGMLTGQLLPASGPDPCAAAYPACAF